jgi:hypothetical protein
MVLIVESIQGLKNFDDAKSDRLLECLAPRLRVPAGAVFMAGGPEPEGVLTGSDPGPSPHFPVCLSPCSPLRACCFTPNICSMAPRPRRRRTARSRAGSQLSLSLPARRGPDDTNRSVEMPGTGTSGRMIYHSSGGMERLSGERVSPSSAAPSSPHPPSGPLSRSPGPRRGFSFACGTDCAQVAILGRV